MLGAYLFAMIAAMACAIALVWLLMWAIRRWVHIYASILVGVLVVGFLIQTIVRGVIHCSQPGEWSPPSPEEGDEGAMLHNCDAAGGVLDRIYLGLAGPLAVAAMLLFVWRYWCNPKARASRT